MTLMPQSTLLRWRPDLLSEPAASLRGAGQSLREHADAICVAVTNPGTAGSWVGAGQRAAELRVEADRESFRRAANLLDELAETMDGTAKALGYPIDQIKSLLQYLPSYLSVGEYWSVDVVDPDPTPEQQNEAANLANTLRSHAATATSADAAGAEAITAVVAELTASLPTSAAVGGDAGAVDAQAILAGEVNPEILARLEAASDLTPQQLEELSAGRPVTLSRGQFDYLSAMMRSLDGVPVEQLAAFGDSADDPDAARTNLVDAMQIISNPAVTAGEVDVWGPDSVPRGGLDHLPADVRSLLVDDPTTEWTRRVTDDGGVFLPDGSHFESGHHVPRLNDFTSFTDMVASGSEELRSGTDIDRALIDQAAAISAVGNVEGFTDPSGYTSDTGAIDSTLSSMLEVASTDNTAVTDAITGTDMPGDYDRDSALTAVLTRDWGENATGAQAMIDTVRTHADLPENPTAADVLRWEQSAASASALGHFMSENKPDLVNIPHQGNTPIGELNPGITVSLAEAVSPYLDGFIDAPSDFSPRPDVDYFTNRTDMANMFSVLNTNPDAAIAVNTAGIHTIDEFVRRFGEDPLSPTATAWGERAGILAGAMDMGAEMQYQESMADAHGEAIAEFEHRGYVSHSLGGWITSVPVAGDLAAAVMPAIDYTTNPTPNPFQAEGDTTARGIAQEVTENRLYVAYLQGISQQYLEILTYETIPDLLLGNKEISPEDIVNLRANLDSWSRENDIPLDILKVRVKDSSDKESWGLL